MFRTVGTWLHSKKYLPEFMRDFHDQKDLFKAMHTLYSGSESLKMTWVDGHIYVIDCFLWFMASRGYTLQKSRVLLDFKPLPNYREMQTPIAKVIEGKLLIK